MLQCKLLGLAVAALLCIGGSAQAGMISYYNAVTADNPVVYYQFDEAAGTTTAVNYGSAASADGTYTNVTLGETSAFAGLGTCGGYNGTVGATGSRTMVPAGVTAMSVGAGDFTVELWYLTNQTARGDLFVNRNDKTGTAERSFALINNWPNRPASVTVYQSQGINQYVSSADATWHHIVVTRTSGNYDIYVDGSKTVLGSQTTITNFDSTWNGPKGIGSNWGTSGSTQPLLGYVDEFAFYGTALSQERVSAHYAAAQVPEPSTLALLGCGLIGLLAYAWRKRR